MLRKFNRALTLAGLGLLVTSVAFASGESPKTKGKRASRNEASIEIKAVPVGPTDEIIAQVSEIVGRSAAVQKELGGSDFRQISFNYIEQSDKNTVGIVNPQQFQITYYDYTNDRTVLATGEFASPENVRITEDASKPFPSAEELESAAALVARDGNFAAGIKKQYLRTFEPMPPLTIDPKTGERLINIGIEAMDATSRNEVVSVSFKRGIVIRYESAAPPTSLAEPDNCGIAAGSGGTAGSTGQYQMTVSQNGAPLWEFLVIRPSASSGASSERSGIELRDVRYKGKMLLKRGHAPVLNVQYVNNVCGPYRDWQYSEGGFMAPDAGAQDPAPGIRILAAGQIATTALDTGNDTGNFRGVAVYRQNGETVMVSEMNAGWYRYIMEWRLSDDGTIRPRYGYGATKNSCVCSVHTHHTYWRFDFDIGSATNKIFQVERGRKFMTPMATESKFLRREQTGRSLIVENSTGNESVMLIPSLNDGKVDTYGNSDFWALRYKEVGGAVGEIDDPNTSTAINLDPWINGESLVDQDIVVWYGAHFIHADGASLLNPNRNGNDILSGSHVVGPDIRLVRW